ncbi:hypothetical protein HYX05_00950 [Candidatus Woesearchaeota archaeon]|nr:hypothetical protein [Candidatus Woesearchaeota archaeon]
MKPNKKGVNLAILALTLLLLLSTIAYAKPFTDAFTGGLTQINDFFVNEQYKAYATAIDFFFFALLFISVYMIGIRYAFKEVKKPEKVIAVLLGLMTAFLLVLGGFSATILLPYIHWLLYLLLFMFYWWLLKGIKSKFWRFILALLLTLLTIGLVQGLFGAFAPDTEGFFSSLSKSFAGIQFPETPGVPSYVTDLFGAPVAAPTGPDLTTLPTTTTPVEEKRGQGWLPGGYSAGHLFWILPLLLALAYGGLRLFRRARGERGQPSTIIDEIEEIINKKTAKMTEVKQANQEKNQMIQAGENIETLIRNLKDPSYTWEAVRSYQEGHPLRDLYNKELQLITKLKELMDLEKTEFLETKLVNWQERIMRETGINDANKQRIVQQLDELRVLLRHKTSIRDIRNMGILWLIAVCYDFEKREAKLNKELDQLLQEHNVEELIKDKFAKVKEDNRKLLTYNSTENFIIKLLNQKIELQKNMLEGLKGMISGQIAAPQSAPNVIAFFNGFFTLLIDTKSKTGDARNMEFNRIDEHLSSGASQGILDVNQFGDLTSVSGFLKIKNFDGAVTFLSDDKTKQDFEPFKPNLDVIERLLGIIEELRTGEVPATPAPQQTAQPPMATAEVVPPGTFEAAQQAPSLPRRKRMGSRMTANQDSDRAARFSQKAFAILASLPKSQQKLGEGILDLCISFEKGKFNEAINRTKAMYKKKLIDEAQTFYLMNVSKMLEDNIISEALKLMNSKEFKAKPFGILREFLKNIVAESRPRRESVTSSRITLPPISEASAPASLAAPLTEPLTKEEFLRQFIAKIRANEIDNAWNLISVGLEKRFLNNAEDYALSYIVHTLGQDEADKFNQIKVFLNLDYARNALSQELIQQLLAVIEELAGPASHDEIMNDIVQLHNSGNFQNLRQKYNAIRFGVMNAVEVFRNPSATPIFNENESGSHWILKINNQMGYVVPHVPMIGGAEIEAGSLTTAFDVRNYRKGYRYRKIRLISPALFVKSGNRWLVSRKGVLELGNEEPEV